MQIYQFISCLSLLLFSRITVTLMHTEIHYPVLPLPSARLLRRQKYAVWRRGALHHRLNWPGQGASAPSALFVLPSLFPLRPRKFQHASIQTAILFFFFVAFVFPRKIRCGFKECHSTVWLGKSLRASPAAGVANQPSFRLFSSSQPSLPTFARLY